ncbi:alkaline phosphatase [Wenzhouxiangella sp. XN79A]|uniref:alkaline phosphatase n=1 Tax=Wenzhouxiangella sp. XN79A TaxID=2724193 RepID=UPI00144A72A2|nr:alkaline phosphatase [Wenzhouxiangella sp. XN79A]NKI34697.1 alkaline phosphatase [Wenzhouxiangella sp. XN79A]
MSFIRFLSVGLALALAGASVAQEPTGRGAIFFHPDGASAAHWEAARMLYVGPDGRLNWDRYPHLAPYRGHLADQLVATSNGGAVSHATGTRAHARSFGMDPDGKEMVSADGTNLTIVEAAIEAGIPTALIQSGSLIEPGTAAFVAEAERRGHYERIALQVVESGVDLHFGGGEQWLLPEGVQGRFGPGRRSDGRNLVEELRQAGYAVVQTRDELMALPEDVTRVFGVFAEDHTFFDDSEEDLAEAGKPHFLASAPTMAEMTSFALDRLTDDPRGFLFVIEEEGSDNFCNKINAAGCLEALKRADDAAGRLLDFVEAHPETLLVTAADSNAAGMNVLNIPQGMSTVPARGPNVGGLMDGREGTSTAPFLSAPDAEGRRFPFAIVWATSADVGGGVIARGAGWQADRFLDPAGVHNIDIYAMLYETLFGEPPSAD